MALAASSILLHSKYDPHKEAIRFVDSQKISFIPAFIVISEPAESYIAKVARQKYPKTKIIALRYHQNQFLDSDTQWDAVWRPDHGISIKDYLYTLISDEYIPLTVFWAWKPSDTVWPEMAQYVWTGISSLLSLQTGIMQTRSWFGKKWLSNMIKNVVLSKHAIYPLFTEKPIFLAAAGPSLEKNVLVENKTFFICAVSSALMCLEAHKQKTDVCIATDGGYWALAHLQHIHNTIPVAFPLEAAIPSPVLQSNPLILLNYGSEIEKCLFMIMNTETVTAYRNGSVSGTAAQFALSHTNDFVYASGLDLAKTNSFTHARPHITDMAMEQTLDRFHPISSVLYSTNIDNNSLDMYASWFSSQNEQFKKRFYRLQPVTQEIDGLETKYLSEIKTKLNLTTDTICFQNTQDTVKKKEKVLFWLNELCNTLHTFSHIEEIQGNLLYIEILQMVSYTDYLHVLKEHNSYNKTSDANDLVINLCVKSINFLEKLKTMVSKYDC